MKVFACAVLASVLAISSVAAAQASSGEAGCAKILTDTRAQCIKLAADQTALSALSGSEQDRAKNAAKLAELSGEIAILSARPLVRLGLCVSITDTTQNTCDSLATRLDPDESDPKDVKPLAAETRAKAAPEDRQLAREASEADRMTSTNKSGASAQLEPVESVQPITLAGGAITLSGTGSGTKGVATITINPLALTMPDDAIAGRMFDLTVSAPFDLDHGTRENRRYVSARLRTNLTAPISAAALNQKVSAWLNAAGRYADKLQTVLQQASDVQACVDAIAESGKVSKAACGQDLDSAEVRAARESAYADMAQAQRAADKYYLGLDVRFDTGDPTGPDLVGDKGTHLLGGIAAGIRLSQGERWDWEIRGRAAGDYFQSRDAAVGPNPSAVYSFDWGAAFIFSGRLSERAKQRMAFGVGVEGRHAATNTLEAKLSPTNYVHLNLMTIVPAMTGGDFGLGISIPLSDSRIARGFQINFTTDLGLLDHSAE